MKLLIASLTIFCVVASAHATDKAKLDDQIRELTAKFAAMQQKPDKSIPAEILRKAQGIILLDRTKAGFIFGFQGGSGVSMVKDAKTGQWGPAAFLNASEVSLGAQIGIQRSFIVVLFMTPNAARAMTQPNFEFGGEARGTGDDASSGVQGLINTREQAMLVFDDRKGLYGGAVLKCGSLSPNPHANLAYYGEAVATQDILFDKQVKASEAAMELARQINDPNAAALAANTPRARRKMKPAEPPFKEHYMMMASRPPQSPANATTSAPNMNGGTGQLMSLIAELETNQQTNAIRLLNSYLTTLTSNLQAADADTTTAVLEQLRAGHTSQAIEMLESRLNATSTGLDTSKQYSKAFPQRTTGTNAGSRAWESSDNRR